MIYVRFQVRKWVPIFLHFLLFSTASSLVYFSVKFNKIRIFKIIFIGLRFDKKILKRKFFTNGAKNCLGFFIYCDTMALLYLNVYKKFNTQSPIKRNFQNKYTIFITLKCFKIDA